VAHLLRPSTRFGAAGAHGQGRTHLGHALCLAPAIQLDLRASGLLRARAKRQHLFSLQATNCAAACAGMHQPCFGHGYLGHFFAKPLRQGLLWLRQSRTSASISLARRVVADAKACALQQVPSTAQGHQVRLGARASRRRALRFFSVRAPPTVFAPPPAKRRRTPATLLRCTAAGPGNARIILLCWQRGRKDAGARCRSRTESLVRRCRSLQGEAFFFAEGNDLLLRWHSPQSLSLLATLMKH
jgi:hypothetical protein